MNDALTLDHRDRLLGLEEAAAYLGCPPRTLRKVIDRSRLRLRGLPVRGPTLQFFQAHPRAALRFRRAWLDAYVEAGTHRPQSAPLVTRGARPAPRRASAEIAPLSDSDLAAIPAAFLQR